MGYNFTGLENSTNFYEIFTVVNSSSNDLLVGFILLMVFFVTFISFKSFETITALRTSAFITGIIAVLFFSIDLLSLTYMIIPVVLLGLIVFYTMLVKD